MKPWLLPWLLMAAHDYHAPAPSADRVHPAAILLHGGDLASGSTRGADELALIRVLTQAGYAVFAIHYRLAPQHPYPAALDDVKAAVQSLRLDARRLKADPKQIVLVGIGAGGYLANLSGGAGVRAVVSLSAPSDLRGWPVEPALRSFLSPLIELRGLEPALAEASPVMHIRPDAPPFLLIHGDKDDTVPVIQATHWQNALQAAGVSCNLMLIRGGGHEPAGWDRLADARDWRAELAAWLNAALGRPTPSRAKSGVR